jgi:SAM-dependent methyltransferase
MQTTSIDTENPVEHWRYINVENRNVLDLGCGRWEEVEKRDQTWPTTPEYFILNGAKKVVGIDLSEIEIQWFKNKYLDDPRYSFINEHLNSSQKIEELINQIKPECIKCDIEGGEQYLLTMHKDIFCSIKEYYIETHSYNLLRLAIKAFEYYKYNITNIIDLSHTNGTCKVIFANKP